MADIRITTKDTLGRDLLVVEATADTELRVTSAGVTIETAARSAIVGIAARAEVAATAAEVASAYSQSASATASAASTAVTALVAEHIAKMVAHGASVPVAKKPKRRTAVKKPKRRGKSK